MEIPRPRDQRPVLHPSFSDTSTIQKRPITFDNPVQAETRLQKLYLPGVRHILTEASTPSETPVRPQWFKQSQSSAYFSHGDGSYQNRVLHPPMTLPPPQTSNGYYQGQPRTFDVPVLETTRVDRHPSQSLPLSQYPGFHGSAREYQDSHPESVHPVASVANMSNGTRHSYTLSVTNDRQQPSLATAFDRSSSMPYSATQAEAQRQYLGVQEVPGQGACHVFTDGGRLPTHVDGEHVNPAWGLTKAMKPRKRLALACLDCREKKIKCEPGTNACLQCEKAKRPCRRAPGQNSQSAPSPGSWPGSANSPVRKNPSTSDPTPTIERSMDIEPANKRRDRADPSPPNVPSKKHRSTSPMSGVHNTTAETPAQASTYHDGKDLSSVEGARQGLMTWDEDPYDVDPELTMHLLDLYFEHMNSAVYWLYPRDHFLQWTRTCTPKCQNERMVLYAMLAAASVFASKNLAGFGKECARVAGDAICSQIGRFNVSVAHTKMMLALYHFAKGSIGIPWDHVGSAIRTITFLQLHTEDGCYNNASSAAQARVEFQLSTEQLAECKRRTFWSCFLMDRLAGPTVCQIKPQDIFLRLPCSEGEYEESARSSAPYYPNENVEPTLTLLTPASPLSPMAWVALVAGIWGDVIDFTFCAPHRPASTYRETYEKFYMDTRNHLQGWSSRLPGPMQYSEANLIESIQGGYFHAFICMHTLYHTTHMKLNQCLRHAQMSDVVTRNIREAHAHAHKQLQMMAAVVRAKQAVIDDLQLKEPVLAVPFAGYGTLIAIDIVGAGGPESSLQPTLELIEGGLVCLRELSIVWNSAKDQLKNCAKRYYHIKNIVTGGQKSRIGAWLGRNWGIDLPIEEDLRKEDDCIYGLGNSDEAITMYFKALAEEEGGQGTSHRALRIA